MVWRIAAGSFPGPALLLVADRKIDLPTPRRDGNSTFHREGSFRNHASQLYGQPTRTLRNLAYPLAFDGLNPCFQKDFRSFQFQVCTQLRRVLVMQKLWDASPWGCAHYFEF